MNPRARLLATLAAITLCTASVSACDAFSGSSEPDRAEQDQTPTDDTAATASAAATGDDSDVSTSTGSDSDLSTATGGDLDAATATALPTPGDLTTSTGDSDLSTATAQPESTSAPTAAPDDADLPAPSLEPADGPASIDAELLPTSVRIGAHDGYDRVVFDLEGTGTPGYSVSYVDSALETGSGAVIDVAGDAILQVLISGTRYPEEDETYEGGPGTYAVDATSEVEEVRVSGTYEGRSQAFIGIDDPDTPFRVFTLADPARVVVDVAHQG